MEQLGGFSAGKNKPDSSKDLEKDEREWTVRHDSYPLPGAPNGATFAEGPQPNHHEFVEVVPKARLQQVETDHAKELSTEARLSAERLEELNHLREIIAEKDLIIKASEQHTQYWENKCAE